MEAVIQFKNCVIDFNYDLIMSADLYYKLTNFEKLNVVSSKRLKQDWARLCNYCGVLEYPYTRDWAILFAYDDYMTRIKERELQK